MRNIVGSDAENLRGVAQSVNLRGGSVSTNELENIFGGVSSAKDESSSSTSTGGSSTTSPFHLDNDSSSDKKDKKKKKINKSSSTSSVSTTTSVSSVDVDERGVDISSFHTSLVGKMESEGNDSYATEEVNAALEMLQNKKVSKEDNFSSEKTAVKHNNKSKYYAEV